MIISLCAYRDARNPEAAALEAAIDAAYPGYYEAPRTLAKKRENIGGLQFYPRLQVYKASNVELCPHSLVSKSYGWWEMSRRIGPHLVFNSYRYSNTTSKHQLKVRRYFRTKGVETLDIESPRGLQNLSSAVAHYRSQIETLHAEIEAPRSQKRKNEERRSRILHLSSMIQTVERLMSLEVRA